MAAAKQLGLDFPQELSETKIRIVDVFFSSNF
jgi:hypothetical protein